ncbi:hypothetical protein RCL1_000178 [Eukaryota sp. TZLM3-RCL]
MSTPGNTRREADDEEVSPPRKVQRLEDSPQFRANFPCWIELQTPDVEKAIEFYGAIYSLDKTVVLAGTENEYIRLTHDDQEPVMGLFKKEGTGHFIVSFAVDNIEEMKTKVTELGGSTVHDVRTVADLGKVALVRDTTGVEFQLWEPLTFKGIHYEHQKTGLAWLELRSSDIEKSKDFYDKLFNFETHSHGEYHTFKQGETSVGGLVQCSSNTWRPFFLVENLEQVREKVVDHGGEDVSDIETTCRDRIQQFTFKGVSGEKCGAFIYLDQEEAAKNKPKTD